jgi:hypothetical protein
MSNGVPAGDSHHGSKLTKETVRELLRMVQWQS